jgi:hypothetical protein
VVVLRDDGVDNGIAVGAVATTMGSKSFCGTDR